MKKLISIILSVAMLISVTGVAASAEYGDCDLSFAVASDLHINVDETELEWAPSTGSSAINLALYSLK